MINIFIDSNVYINMLTDSEEWEYFNELRVLVNQGYVRLIVTEIVILELEKINRNSIEKFKNERGCIIRETKKMFSNKWSEVRDIEKDIECIVEEKIDMKIERWENNYKDLVEYLKSSNVKHVPFTPEIMCNGIKRLISDKIVRKNKDSEKKVQNREANNNMLIKTDDSSQDVYNIESLIQLLLELKNDDTEMVICTNDKKDFFGEKEQFNGFHKINEVYIENFENTRCIVSVSKLMKYYNYGYEYINEEKVDKSKLNELNKREDLDEEEYAEMFGEADYDYLLNLRQVFNKEIENRSEAIQKYRKSLIGEINDIFRDLRKLESWDDRSEYKLSVWLEDRSEEKITISKLSDLIKIRSNLTRCFEINTESDEGDENV